MAYDTTAERVNFAYRLAYGRPATLEEINEAAGFLQQATLNLQKLKIPAENMRRMALASYCRVLMSSNEFLYVD
jgi:hypothetical protein